MAAAEGEVTAISFDDFDEVWEEEDAPAVPSPGRIEEIENKKTEVELTRITRVRDADFTRIGVLAWVSARLCWPTKAQVIYMP